MKNEEKSLKIAKLCNNNYEECKTCRLYDCENRGKYVGAIEMAKWKDTKLKNYLKGCIKTAEKTNNSGMMIVFEEMIKELRL